MTLHRSPRFTGAHVLLCVLASACGDDSGGQTTASEASGPTSSATGDSSGSGPTTGTDSATATASSSETSGTSTATTATSTATETASGSGSDSTTGGPPSACTQPSDCVAWEDCCSCTALRQGEDPPPCDLPECFATACGALGINPVAQCELGSCELVPVSCNPFDVTCDSTPPQCPAGTLPSVDPLDSCWSGVCVPAELCDVVPSCDDCPDDEVCVQDISQLPTRACSPIPPECAGTPTCACMGEVCVAPFDVCGDGDGTITCSCPAC